MDRTVVCVWFGGGGVRMEYIIWHRCRGLLFGKIERGGFGLGFDCSPLVLEMVVARYLKCDSSILTYRMSRSILVVI